MSVILCGLNCQASVLSFGQYRQTQSVMNTCMKFTVKQTMQCKFVFQNYFSLSLSLSLSLSQITGVEIKSVSVRIVLVQIIICIEYQSQDRMHSFFKFDNFQFEDQTHKIFINFLDTRPEKQKISRKTSKHGGQKDNVILNSVQVYCLVFRSPESLR